MKDGRQSHETFYRIERGIPVPQKYQVAKYPFEIMEVGDSFFVTNISRSYIALKKRVLRPKRFACRTVFENGVRGTRIWRIE